MTTRYEAAATLAAYAPEVYSEEAYGLAGEIALGRCENPAAAVDRMLASTSVHPRMSLESWLALPDTAQKIDERVVLQERFAPYEALARRAGSLSLSVLTVAPFYRRHVGSQSIANEVKDAEGGRAFLKVPYRSLLNHSSSPARTRLRPYDRAHFAEDRIHLLPALPGTNFEQMKAASYAGAVVTSAVAGRPLYKLDEQELQQITDGHLLSGVFDLARMAEAGVEHDSNGANSHFAKDSGFGFFDPLGRGSSKAWCLISNMQGFGRTLASIDSDTPKRARTQVCAAIRRDLFARLQSLAPETPDNIAAVLAKVELRPSYQDIG